MSRDIDHLAAMLLLGGSVRGNPLEEAVARSLMNLPVRAGQTILDIWHQAAHETALTLGLPSLRVRALIGQQSRSPTLHSDFPGAQIEIERDPEELRGPGGVLADVAADLPDEALLLVASGNQIPVEPLSELVQALFDHLEDGAILAHEDGRPVTLFLIRCKALRSIPKVGFVDFKEQSLPKIAELFRIQVVTWPRPAIQTVRTREDYLSALRTVHASQRDRDLHSSLGRAHEPWQPIFSIVEEGALMAEGVDLLDSVVLAGARVDEGAVVVRSVVCPGAVIASGQMVMDKLARA